MKRRTDKKVACDRVPLFGGSLAALSRGRRRARNSVLSDPGVA